MKKLSLFFFFASFALFLSREQLVKKALLTFAQESPCGCNPQTASGEFLKRESSALFHGQEIKPPSQEFKPEQIAVLGETTSIQTNKWIEVDLSEQTLRAFENGQLIMETKVSTGKWGRTPTGTFTIANKFRYVKMSGGSRELGTYYYLPNVPYVMFFGNSQIPESRGFSLHGTYWHNNFGTPMSHGCINLSVPDSEKLFAWARPEMTDGVSSQAASQENPGTKVIIHE